MTIRKIRWPIYAAVLALSANGCATHAESGAAAGSILGGTAGALIGGARGGNALAGAAVGAGLGAVGGALVGAGQDENDRKNAVRYAAATQPQVPLVSVGEIVNMSRSGLSDANIITSIRNSHSAYQLTTAQIVDLHNQGVSDAVLQEMQDTAHRPVVMAGPRVYPPPVYYCEPPPPRVGFSVGYGYYGRPWRRW